MSGVYLYERDSLECNFNLILRTLKKIIFFDFANSKNEIKFIFKVLLFCMSFWCYFRGLTV